MADTQETQEHNNDSDAFQSAIVFINMKAKRKRIKGEHKNHLKKLIKINANYAAAKNNFYSKVKQQPTK